MTPCIKPPASSCGGVCSMRAHIMGVSVSDTTSEMTMATARVMANSWNRRPTTSGMNSSGINTATSEKVSDIRVKPISPAPANAACIGDLPISRCRATFSSMTMASSTTKPVAMVSAISVRLLTEKSIRYMKAKVPTSDSGTATLGMMVAEGLRKNAKVTSTTRPMANSSSFWVSLTEARILWVRSVSTATSTAAGRVEVSCGSNSRTLSVTSITLAPGWRCTFSSTAGWLLAQAARKRSSAPSTMVATSPRRSGAPSCQVMISLR